MQSYDSLLQTLTFGPKSHVSAGFGTINWNQDPLYKKD